MNNKILILIISLIGAFTMNGQVVVTCSKVDGVVSQLNGVQSTDITGVQKSKTIAFFTQEKCTVENLVSLDWVNEFVKRNHICDDNFEIQMIVPLNDHRVVVVGKANDVLGYIEILKPAPEE